MDWGYTNVNHIPENNMKILQSLTLSGIESDRIADLITRLRSEKAHAFWKPIPRIASYLPRTNFGFQDRLVFFCPTYQGKVCVIELPTDDPSPTTMFDIMNRPLINGRWRIVKSSIAERHELTLRKYFGCRVSTCDQERITVPEYQCFPDDINIAGATRQGLQVHGVTSTSRSKAEGRMDPLEGGAFCSVTDNQPVQIKGATFVNHGASRGCAFVSSIDRLNDGGKYAALLHVGGVGNTYFSFAQNSNAGPLAIFNFETDDPVFKPVWEESLLGPRQSLCLIDVLNWYTHLVVSAYAKDVSKS